MSELQTFHILVERVVTVDEASEVAVEATNIDEAMQIAEALYYDDAISFDEVDRDFGDAYFSKI